MGAPISFDVADGLVTLLSSAPCILGYQPARISSDMRYIGRKINSLFV